MKRHLDGHLALLLSVGLLVACENREGEVYRIANQATPVEVVVTRDGGAEDQEALYRAYLVPTGGAPVRGQEVFRATGVTDFQVSWANPKLLVIQYTSAEIDRFRNTWRSAEVGNVQWPIEIQLWAPQRQWKDDSASTAK